MNLRVDLEIEYVCELLGNYCYKYRKLDMQRKGKSVKDRDISKMMNLEKRN